MSENKLLDLSFEFAVAIWYNQFDKPEFDKGV